MVARPGAAVLLPTTSPLALHVRQAQHRLLTARLPAAAPPSSALAGTGAGLAKILTAAAFKQLFPNIDNSGCKPGFYTYDALLKAAAAFPGFATSADEATNRRELSAFLAHISQETNGGWAAAPASTGGPYAWGLCKVEEGEGRPPSSYCDPSNAKYPCAAGKSYHGRGPIQLSWNYNYGQAGEALGAPLLARPELVLSDAVVSFKTGEWPWDGVPRAWAPLWLQPCCFCPLGGSVGWTSACLRR